MLDTPTTQCLSSCLVSVLLLFCYAVLWMWWRWTWNRHPFTLQTIAWMPNHANTCWSQLMQQNILLLLQHTKLSSRLVFQPFPSVPRSCKSDAYITKVLQAGHSNKVKVDQQTQIHVAITSCVDSHYALRFAMWIILIIKRRGCRMTWHLMLIIHIAIPDKQTIKHCIRELCDHMTLLAHLQVLQ